MKLILPEGYDPKLSVRETQDAIKYIRDKFQKVFAREMNLERISAPLFLTHGSGLNDDLNGVERKVSFDLKSMPGEEMEIVQSLAKWKRMALGRYGFLPGEGLYTNMNAIRRDEDLDNLHSVYVDQWDWEKVILKEQRTVETLKETVKAVYDALRVTEKYMSNHYDYIKCILPEQITFVTSQELIDLYPGMSVKEREYAIAKEKGAVFIMQIGDKLSDGKPHDGRAPDYDDWQLNGDIIVYFPVTDIALELSSMGIRVDEDSMVEQLKKAGCEERMELPFQKAVIEKKLPYTIGGGIGQSRICMFFLRKAHIGEVQVSIWPQDEVDYAKEKGVIIL
jgi:aspartate--ammonia ligase